MNTLDERIEKLRVGTGFPSWSDSVKALILSEAHRIGMEAIGPDYVVDLHTAAKLQMTSNDISKAMQINTFKEAQRQRLSEMTGVKE